MIEKVEMYTIVCDNCYEDIGSESEYSCWNYDNYTEQSAMESDWLKVDSKHYCTKCYSYNDEDELEISLERKDKYKG